MSSLTGRRRVLLNSVIATVLHVVRMASAFIVSPLIVGALGNTLYGFWEVLLSLVAYFGILDVGIGPAILRYVAVADGKGDREEMGRILSTAVSVLLGVGALACLVLGALSLNPQAILDVPHEGSRYVPAAIALTALTLLTRFPGAAFDAYYLGRQKHYFIYSIQLVLVVVFTVANWYLLTRSAAPPLLVVAGAQFGSTVLHHGVVVAFYLLDPNRPPLSPRLASRAKIRELFTFGVKSMLLMVSDRLRRSSMPLVITWTVGLEQVVFYALADKVVAYAGQLARVFGFPLNAYFSSLVDRGDDDTMLREWLDMSRFLQFVHLGLAAAVIMLGADFLARWMGPQYAETAQPLIILLGFSILVTGAAVNAGRMLVSMARHERTVRITMPANIVTVILAVGLVQTIGLVGVGISIAVTSVVATALVLREACRAMKISMGRYVRETLLVAMPSLVVLFALLAFLRQWRPPVGYPELLLDGMLAAVVYAVVAFFTLLRADERRRTYRLIRTRLGRRA